MPSSETMIFFLDLSYFILFPKKTETNPEQNAANDTSSKPPSSDQLQHVKSLREAREEASYETWPGPVCGLLGHPTFQHPPHWLLEKNRTMDRHLPFTKIGSFDFIE